MAQFLNIFKVDLNQGAAPVAQLRQMYYGDAEANRVGADVYMNGEAVSLSGTCSGTAILANGGTVALTGTVSENRAYVDLPSSCYAVEGQIQVFVKLTNDGVTATLVSAVGTVRLTETGTVIDPGTIIPSVSALIADIDAAVESIPEDYSALSNHVEALTGTQKNLFWVTDTSNRTINNVAFKFNADGSITAKGTASGLVTLYLRGATSNTANLTAGTYTITRWTEVGSGNIRVTNNGSNILSSNNVGKVSVTQTFDAAPHLYLTIGNSVAVDGTFRFQIEQGSNATDYELGSEISALDNVARFEAEELEKQRTIRYRFTTATATQGGTDRVQVLIGNVRYDLIHSIDNSIYCNCWRVLSACVSDEYFSFIEGITTSGEWECAVRLQNRDDFSGGYLHGDEVMTAVSWFADGAEISDITAKTAIEKASVFKVVETSNLYDPADHTTVIAEHGKEYVFDANGLTINQSIKWKVNASLERCYLAMYPASKANTTELYCNSEFVRHALNETDYAHEIPKATETTIRGDHLTALFSVPVYPTGLTGGDVMYYGDNGGNSYNKCYYRVCNAGSVTAGDIWVTKTKYDIRYF